MNVLFLNFQDNLLEEELNQDGYKVTFMPVSHDLKANINKVQPEIIVWKLSKIDLKQIKALRTYYNGIIICIIDRYIEPNTFSSIMRNGADECLLYKNANSHNIKKLSKLAMLRHKCKSEIQSTKEKISSVLTN